MERFDSQLTTKSIPSLKRIHRVLEDFWDVFDGREKAEAKRLKEFENELAQRRVEVCVEQCVPLC